MTTRILNTHPASVRVYADADELALKAARRFARLADQYVVGCGRFTVALSGGSTPKAMFSVLAGAPFCDTVPWSSIYFFWETSVAFLLSILIAIIEWRWRHYSRK